MSDDNIDVKIRVQTSEVKSGMGEAANATQQAAERMRKALSGASDGMKSAITGVVDNLKGIGAGMSGAAGATEAGSIAMTGRLGMLAAAVAPAIAAFTALAGAVLAAKAAIEKTAQMTQNAMELGRALGITASEAQTYLLALEDIDTSQGDLIAASKGMSRQLKENEQEMNALGLVTRDAAGNLRPLNDLVVDGVAVLNQYKEGTDRAMASQRLFGRGIDGSSNLLLLNKQVLQDDAKAAEELGLQIGSRGVAAWQDFDAASDRASFSLKGVTKAIGDQLIPIATDLINLFNAVMPAAILVIRGALGGLATAFYAVKNGVVVLWETINAMVVTVAEPLRAMSFAMSKAMRGDFAGAADEIKGIGGVISGAWSGAMQRMTDSSADASSKIAALWSKDSAVGGNGGSDGSKNFKDTKDPKKGKSAESRSSQWETELAEMKTAFQEQANAEGQFRQFSVESELKFWQEKLQLTTKGTAENLSVRKKVADLQQAINKDAFDAEIALLRRQEAEAGNNAAVKLQIAEKEVAEIGRVYGLGSKEYEKAEQRRVQIAREAANQIHQIKDAALETERNRALELVDADADIARLQLDLGNITKEQLLAQEMQFEQRRNEIKLQALNDRLALADPDSDPVKYAQLKAQIEALEILHRQKMRQIATQQAANAAQPETTLFRGMEDAYERALTGILTRTMTLRQALTSIYKQIFTTFLQEMVTKPLAQMMVRFVRETILHKLMGQSQVQSQVAASTQTMTTKATEATAVVGSNAAEAASGAAASQASIPYVGWALAGAAFAATLAMVMGAKSSIKSASGGYDVPAGVNPVTQIHEEEMVLPAHLANPMREMLAGGGGGGGININISALDGHSVKRVLVDNKHAVAAAIRAASRDGAKA